MPILPMGRVWRGLSVVVEVGGCLSMMMKSVMPFWEEVVIEVTQAWVFERLEWGGVDL